MMSEKGIRLNNNYREVVMAGVRVSENFGIVVRKTALSKLNISLSTLFQIMEVEQPFDEDDHLISFGPHFGGEASQYYIKRLETLGLVYGEDFLDFSDMLPSWCHLYIALNA